MSMKSRRARRKKRREERQSHRQDRKDVRMRRRQAKKMKRARHGKSDEETNEILKVQEIQDEMAKQLADDGVQVDDPEDTEEVATKYAQNNDDVDEVVDESDYDTAYFEEAYDEVSHWNKDRAKKIIGGLLGATAGAVNAMVGNVEDKAKRGEKLTDREQALLDAKNQAEQEVLKGQKKKWGGKIIDYLPYLLVIVLVAYIIKKKAS